jgi:hypothetical protein
VLHPDVPVALSQAAGRFFGEEAFEAAWLLAQEEEAAEEDQTEEEKEEDKGVGRGGGSSKGPSCPFSRVRDVGDYGPV